MGTGVVVRAARQGIGTIGSARLVEEADVVVAEHEDVAGKASVDFLGAAVILEVLVVGENIDDEFGAEEKIAPVFKGADDSKEFPIPDWVISFGFSEGGGVTAPRGRVADKRSSLGFRVTWSTAGKFRRF